MVKQDQFVASYGGLNEYIFNKDGSTNVKKLNIKKNFLKQLQNNLFLYFTGYTRSSYKILQVQDRKTKSMDKNMIRNLDQIKEYGYQIRNSLLNSNMSELSLIMKDHWEIKKKDQQIYRCVEFNGTRLFFFTIIRIRSNILGYNKH